MFLEGQQMKLLMLFYKLPTIIKILLGLITFPWGTIILIIANSFAEKFAEAYDIGKRINAIKSNTCDKTVRDLIDYLNKDTDKMIKVSVKVARSQTKSEVPKHLLETYNYISQSDKVSNSVKQEFFNALRNKQVFNNGGNSSHSNFNHMQQMFAENERLNQELIQQEIWQQEELNRQNEQFNQMNQNNTMDNMF